MNRRRRNQRFAAHGQLRFGWLRIAHADCRQTKRRAGFDPTLRCKRFDQPVLLDQQERLIGFMPFHRPFGSAQPAPQSVQAEAQRSGLHRA